jgi:hypothetical protein
LKGVQVQTMLNQLIDVNKQFMVADYGIAHEVSVES